MIEAPPIEDVRKALNIDEAEGAGDIADQNERLTHMVAVAVHFANKQAPDAPEAVGKEAVIRMVGWLYEGPSGVSMSNAGAWRRSGAEGLLARWTVRRAGVIG